MPTLTIHERMMQALDTSKPDWFVVYANGQELADCARACTDGHSGTVHAKNQLRRSVCDRLWDVLRAGVNAGIVEFALQADTKVEQVQD